MFNLNQSVGEIVAVNPSLWKLFEHYHIDYCCHGDKPLAEACREKGLDPEAILTEIENLPAGKDQVQTELLKMTLTELANHIEQTHHVYLYRELPELISLAGRVTATHAARDTRLHQVLQGVTLLQSELMNHLAKEEQILFPMIRELEASNSLPSFHCGSVGNPIRQMLTEHDDASELLQKLRRLTDNYQSPEWVCRSMQTLFTQLQDLEHDLHRHIHKENTILFPASIALEEQKRTGKTCATNC
ncbi:MAG TPA: iron-sulfur cluster repair di-iron protein [Candidatus Rifleibacterium sp.]|nr:iron-sulfur cluster repair di-iron protein [Candidatus Rifleibacterium sp.]HPW59761.1 iron-sulfur cluster repair di-iron protein [Candidatus Rifleibacterium sp.]